MQKETIYIYENDGGTLELLDYLPRSRYDYDYVIEEASYHIKNGVLSIKGNKVNFEKNYQETFEVDEIDDYELNSKYIVGTIKEKTYTMLTWKGFKKITVNESTKYELELKVRTPINIQTSVFLIKKKKTISL